MMDDRNLSNLTPGCSSLDEEELPINSSNLSSSKRLNIASGSNSVRSPETPYGFSLLIFLKILSFRWLQLLPGRRRLWRPELPPPPESSIESSSFQSLLELPPSAQSSDVYPSNNLAPGTDCSSGEDTHFNVESPSTETNFYSCNSNNSDRRSKKHKVLDWVFAIANFILELTLIVFDQISSQHSSLFLPICAGMSFLSVLICICELFYNVRKEGGVWRWNTIPWFYYPSRSSLPVGSFADIVGLVCAFGQFILATVSYCLFLKTGKNPIKISISAAILVFCQLCSKFFKELIIKQDVHESYEQDL